MGERAVYTRAPGGGTAATILTLAARKWYGLRRQSLTLNRAGSSALPSYGARSPVAAPKRADRFGPTLFLLAAAVFVWPLLYFLPRVWPIGGRYSSIDNDFEGLSYCYKVWLLDHLSQGRIPMWSPAEGAGFPSTPIPSPRPSTH